MEYNKGYYSKVYGHMGRDEKYYLLRSKVSFSRYFAGIPGVKNKKVFEYGCGLGQNIFLLKENAVGYDISKASEEFCKKKGINFERDIKKVKEKAFDIVLSSHSLEHVDNPLDTLKLLKTKLKNEGMLILVLPKEFHTKRARVDSLNYHLYSWTFVTAANLLHRGGFKVISTKEFKGALYSKLSPLNRLSFKLYTLAIYTAGKFRDPGELVLFCKKA